MPSFQFERGTHAFCVTEGSEPMGHGWERFELRDRRQAERLLRFGDYNDRDLKRFVRKFETGCGPLDGSKKRLRQKMARRMAEVFATVWRRSTV